MKCKAIKSTKHLIVVQWTR